MAIDQPTPGISAVQEYYGTTLRSSADLRTSACCLVQAPSPVVARALARVHHHVKERFYGCGSPIPPALDGITVLDLGCGSGRDCYVLSQLVGPRGRVIGVDVTNNQISVARAHLDWHSREFGYANVEFKLGRIEDLEKLGIADSSLDLVVSNCVLNLSVDKPRVVKEIFRVLKPGGELYFSDLFADRRIPTALLQDPVLHGECLAGAWYVEDFRRLLASVGCADTRTLSISPVDINDPDINDKIGFATFTSRTVRAFKLPLEDRCEDFGQAAVYRGNLPGHPHTFTLDNCHTFPRGKVVPVCGNTAEMLNATRYAPYFDVIGNKTVHYGMFPCVRADQLSPAPHGSAAICC
jgi:SAM-dependent methyltransferase